MDVIMVCNGVEGFEVICIGKGEMVFLDLIMFEMDGYSVLENVKKEGYKCVVIVILVDI